MIRQGEIYWIDLGEPEGPEPGYMHPHVVIQNNVFNQSRISTVVVCVITSNLNRAKAPGNIPLDLGEAGLSKASVINVSQIFTIDKQNLGKKIGKLSKKRVDQILEGIRLLLEPREID